MDEQESKRGLLCGVTAYTIWGLLPLYFKALAHVSPLEVLAYRIVWSFAFLAAVIALKQRWGQLARALTSRRLVGTLLVTTSVIGLNWFLYIYSIATSQVLQASLGYFINPLVNVALGVIFLGERLRPWQFAGIVLAAIGVLNLAVLGGYVPWIALTLAISFGIYGLLRKTAAIDGLLGLFVETTLLLPLSAGYAIYLQLEGTAKFAGNGAWTDVLMVLSGIVTAVPLLLFTAAARRLDLTTLGFLQYFTPTLQFLIAVFAFGEPFSWPQLASFGCIWGAIAVYSVDSLRAYRAARRRSAAGQLRAPEATAPGGCAAAVRPQPCAEAAN